MLYRDRRRRKKMLYTSPLYFIHPRAFCSREDVYIYVRQELKSADKQMIHSDRRRIRKVQVSLPYWSLHKIPTLPPLQVPTVAPPVLLSSSQFKTLLRSLGRYASRIHLLQSHSTKLSLSALLPSLPFPPFLLVPPSLPSFLSLPSLPPSRD